MHLKHIILFAVTLLFSACSPVSDRNNAGAEGLDEPIDVDLQAPELPDPAPETSSPDNTPSVDFDDWEPTLF